ncbi:MAG TPA: hypothetical protein VM536_01090 [Chloroflexia bacterium]|nr:hypothetical protein [Chloroflexia bacterium]
MTEMLRWKWEYAGLLVGMLLAVGVLGGWQAGVFAAGGRASPGRHLSNYLAPGVLVPIGAPAREAVPDLSGAPIDAQSVLGPPTLTAAAIDSILAGYGSPAAGQGGTFVGLGRQYGIDPAFALAFYVQESHAGTRGVARFTHGIGNIRWTPGFESYEGYRSYPSFGAGIEDWYKLIKTLYVDGWGLTTVGAIVPRYAPAADHNDTASYIANVETLVAGWRARAESRLP